MKVYIRNLCSTRLTVRLNCIFIMNSFLYRIIKLKRLPESICGNIIRLYILRSIFMMETSYEKVNHKLAKNFFFISVVKKGNFNRAPLGCFFKIYRYRYTDLLLEVKFYFVSEHLPDDSDKLAGTVPKCIVVRPAFSPLGIIISL